MGSGITVFAGQRAEAFYVDLGSIFDLGNLRPFQTANVFGKTVFNRNAPGVNATNHLNVHSIAIQVPITAVARTGHPVIGVWTTASRQRVRVWDADHGKNVDSGPFRQVSRLANPLVNEVLIPMGKKDQWNSLPPSDDKLFASYFANPGFSGLLPTLYPGVFPHLDALNKSGKPRADIEAIFLTGIPAGIVPGFTNLTGPIQADMLRLNTSIPPATSKLSTLGVVGGDLAGFPNGRRPIDDVVTIELRALAGLTYPLIDKTFMPDAAAKAVTDGLDGTSVAHPPIGHFPYLGTRTTATTTRPDDRIRSGPDRPGCRRHGARRRDRRPDPVHAARAGRRGDRDQPGRRARGPGAGAARTHSRVRPRPMPGATRYAAVYPGLPAGRYTIWRDEHTPATAATVTGGQVSSCYWPG